LAALLLFANRLIHNAHDHKHHACIPPGFAHGFVVTSESADVLYKTTNYYAPEHERCIRWNDPDLAIGWPPNLMPLLSTKDSDAPLLRCCELPD
jgi:dTDP-4-dehydrorhamnose 3,5-epimerase